MVKQGGVTREHGSSTVQKFTFWFLHFGIVAFCAWLALGDGLTRVGALFGMEWSLSDPDRAALLVSFALVYCLRHAVTLFYLFVRQVAWSEALGLVFFMAVFEIGLVVVGGGAFRAEPVPFSWLDAIAIGLFAIGSWLNSWSEIQRKLWKADPANKGHCYAGGLFAHAMHINYFGDVVLFTGWCLATHNLWTLALPLLMGLSFAYMHIPALDAYLAERYGREFDDYSARTRKLIPFVW